MKVGSQAVGRCYCGSIEYVIGLPVKFCIHCHCRKCRGMHGAAMVTWVGVAIENFKVSGQKHLKWHQSTDHSKRAFCTICGTSIFYMSTKFPGDIHVTRASLIGKVDVVPTAHIFFDQHVDWFSFEDRLVRLGGPEGTDPLDS